MTLRSSTPEQEGIFQASKYLKVQMLIDEEELKNLFERLSPCFLYPLTGLVDGEAIEQARFVKEYGSWIEELKQAHVPSDAALRRILAAALTADPAALWKQPLPRGRYLIKIASPIVQVQAHFFTYSSIDGVFRPMTMGSSSIFWGLQFSFPQVYQDPKTMEFKEVEAAPNLRLFQLLRQWTREETRATPFLVDQARINAPIRLGKRCFSWIQRHPQLIEQKIGVYAD